MYKALLLTLLGTVTLLATGKHAPHSYTFKSEMQHPMEGNEIYHIHRDKHDLQNPGVEGLHFIEGFMKGLLHEDVSAIEQCATGASGVITHID